MGKVHILKDNSTLGHPSEKRRRFLKLHNVIQHQYKLISDKRFYFCLSFTRSLIITYYFTVKVSSALGKSQNSRYRFLLLLPISRPDSLNDLSKYVLAHFCYRLFCYHSNCGHVAIFTVCPNTRLLI